MATLAESIRATLNKITESTMVEITTATREEVEKAWPNVLYKGAEFFDDYIEQAAMIPSKYNIEAQECYLGYSKAEDAFFIGFDVWPENSDEGGYAIYDMQFRDNAFTSVHEVDSGEGVMFYGSRSHGRSGGYDEVKKNVPDILDLRLD